MFDASAGLPVQAVASDTADEQLTEAALAGGRSLHPLLVPAQLTAV